MKRPALLVCACLALVVIGVGLLIYRRFDQRELRVNAATLAERDFPPESTNASITNAEGDRIRPAKQGSQQSPSSDPNLNYVESKKADPDYDWKQPILFYGIVVDESENPVAQANAHFKWTDLSPSGTSEADVMSTADGRFMLSEKQGKRLSVTVSKAGYYAPKAEALMNFEFASPADGLHTPDAAAPIIFHLHKKGQTENLIHGLKMFGCRIDATISYVNLTNATQRLTPPGDITLRMMRSVRGADRKFDWSLTIGVPEGGIIESTNEFEFVAPEAGYSPRYEITHKANDPDWVSMEMRRFFVKSFGGQHYARVQIKVRSEYSQQAACDIEWYLNPAGSRNLESDPSKLINVP